MVYEESMDKLSWKQLSYALPVIKTIEHVHTYLYGKKLMMGMDQQWFFKFRTKGATYSNRRLE